MYYCILGNCDNEATHYYHWRYNNNSIGRGKIGYYIPIEYYYFYCGDCFYEINLDWQVKTYLILDKGEIEDLRIQTKLENERLCN